MRRPDVRPSLSAGCNSMSDPLADLAKTLPPSDPQTPVPPPSGPTFIFGIVNTVNKDGTVLAALNGSTGNPSTVLCGSDFVPVVGQKIMVLEQGMVFRGIAVVADSHTIGGGFTSGDVKTSIVNADQPGWWVMDGRSTTALAQPALPPDSRSRHRVRFHPRHWWNGISRERRVGRARRQHRGYGHRYHAGHQHRWRWAGLQPAVARCDLSDQAVAGANPLVPAPHPCLLYTSPSPRD